MLDIKSFVVSECNVYKCLKYYGSKHYYIFDGGKSFTLIAVETYGDGWEKEESKQYTCGSLSSAIASIEAMERGEEV